MSDECRCCGGRCGSVPLEDFSRRDFLGKLAAGAAGAALAAELAWAKPPASVQPLTLPPGPKAYPLTPPRVYRGKSLEAVAMPLGGIGTGSIWLDGQGRLAVWQIFNNLSEPRIPDSVFAVRVRTNGQTVTRVLQTEAEGALLPMASVEYEGGYPIARLSFTDPALPVQVRLEALNPLIPLDTANSSIPCAIFRLTAHNPGKIAAEVAFSASLQNAVGSRGAAGIEGVKFHGYGGNRNQVVREEGMTVVAMGQSPDAVQPGPIKVRQSSGQESPGPEMVWLAGAAGWTAETADALARIAEQGGVALVEGVSPGFLRAVNALRAEHPDLAGIGEVFEDFEKRDYAGWTLTGTAFGKGPAHGTLPGQQPVSGFVGHGLVNTFLQGDAPQGTATSKKFRIARRYIGFLIGGGTKAHKTCVNLLVDGKIVRTASGKDRETLEPAAWDVADLHGKEAVIEIVDRSSEGWGHINVDQIIFCELPPEPFLRQGTSLQAAARALKLAFGQPSDVRLASNVLINVDAVRRHPQSSGGRSMPAQDAPPAVAALAGLTSAGPWPVMDYTRLGEFHPGENGYQALVQTPQGDPLVIEGPLGKGRILLVLARKLPWSWGSRPGLGLARRSVETGRASRAGLAGLGHHGPGGAAIPRPWPCPVGPAPSSWRLSPPIRPPANLRPRRWRARRARRSMRPWACPSSCRRASRGR